MSDEPLIPDHVPLLPSRAMTKRLLRYARPYALPLCGSLALLLAMSAEGYAQVSSKVTAEVAAILDQR